MAISKVETPSDLTAKLEGVSHAWDERQKHHTAEAARIRSDAEDQAARYVIPDPARRAVVLGQLEAVAERDAGQHEAKAAAYQARATAARDRGMFVDDGDVSHQIQHADLYGDAVRAGRVAFEPAGSQAVIFSGERASEQFLAAVERRFQERAGIPRSEIASVMRRNTLADALPSASSGSSGSARASLG